MNIKDLSISSDSMTLILLSTNFEVIPPKYGGEVTFSVGVDALHPILDFCHIIFPPRAPMALILKFLESQ